MATHCDRRNPLKRSGSHQPARRLPALDPAYFQVDERDTADLILQAGRFARFLTYYDGANQPNGNWQEFFTSDLAAILAGLGRMPVEALQGFGRTLQQYLEEEPGRAEDDLSAHFKLLFHLPLFLLSEISGHYGRLPRDHALRGFIANVMTRDVAGPLARSLGYFRGAAALPFPPPDDALLDEGPLLPGDYNTTFDDANPRIQLPSAVTTRMETAPAAPALALDPEMIDGFAPGGWNAWYSGLPADSAPYEESHPDDYAQIYDALNFNLLGTALERLYQAAARIATEAERHLDASLTTFAEHPPHYGLFLAFLRLFEINQEHLNEFTGRHLEYYYRDVLQLCPRGAVSNRAHLLFELSKNVEAHLLPAGTLFRGGKDEEGRERLFSLDQDFVANRARVVELRALYRPTVETPSGPVQIPVASVVANSRDGQGEELPEEQPDWPPFGPATAPFATVGFAIADKQLFLREGRRTIWFSAEPDIPLPARDFSPAFRVHLTGDEGWVTISEPTQRVVWGLFGQFLLGVELDGEMPPIVPYDPEIHGAGYDHNLPMMRVEVDFDADAVGSASLFDPLKDLTFKSSLLVCFVQDVRNLLVASDTGVVDPAKPFLPFGPTPERNASLILGSSELFSKRLSGITLNLTWADVLANSYYDTPTPAEHQVRQRHLKNGSWIGNGSYNTTIFSSSSTTVQVNLTDQLDEMSSAVPQTMENPPLSAESSRGFLRLDLEKGFGHRAQIDAKTLALMDYARDGGTYSGPGEPYTPKLNEFSVDYSTAAAAPARLYHLLPFGSREVAPAAGRLFPRLEHEGALYIGVEHLEPPARLSLLIQVANGTANPLKAPPPLLWHMLVGDEWEDLEMQEVDDKSHGLTTSGIVGLAVPEEADLAHRILPSGRHWFRLAAAADSDGLNRLLSIDAQAAAVTLVPPEGEREFAVETLAAGTIAKFKSGVAEVKKVVQPYATFGGRPAEEPEAFHVRASERLRHKDRAVTVWDYEQLILEAFPSIYRVRCVNHTDLLRNAANEIVADNEVAPGHVLVVTIPYVMPESAVDPLLPYTDQRTLGEVDRFLRSRISPFVDLEVQNPRFEQVQVQFKVAFHPEIADIKFYLDELNAAIVRYLSPWAYEEGAEISFGGRWHKAAIINFVEEQSYVDYLKDFKMYHKKEIGLADGAWTRVDTEVVAATTARSILVSHPDHDIEEIL